ncbi:hypothetical protein [Kitasatospora sp. NPDC091276]|uniref:hypothetical protein n=1 Tax=unclassified Kitasatospora TaxID=2633591 RepID=UPI0034220805
MAIESISTFLRTGSPDIDIVEADLGYSVDEVDRQIHSCQAVGYGGSTHLRAPATGHESGMQVPYGHAGRVEPTPHQQGRRVCLLTSAT